jgi:hypothetical protein
MIFADFNRNFTLEEMLDFLPNIKSAIISDRKAISSQLLSSLSVLEFIFKQIFA